MKEPSRAKLPPGTEFRRSTPGISPAGRRLLNASYVSFAINEVPKVRALRAPRSLA